MSDTDRSTCAVIGAGLGGVAVCANLGVAGYRMRLHDLNGARLTALRTRGGIDVEGLVQGFAPLERVTTDLAEAVDGADVIIVCTGSHYHAEVARSLARLLRDGQTILLIQGGTGGALLVRRELRLAGSRAEIDLAEMDNYPYSLGWPEPSRMRMTIKKQFLQIASLPAARLGAVMARLGPAFPEATGAPHVLYTGLNNMNATLHVVNMVANIGRLESTGHGYRFYAEGYTPSIIGLLEALDAERLAVAKAFGVKLPGIHEWLTKTYGFREPSLRETFHRLTHDPAGPYQWTPTPKSLEHKYVIEDVPCGLVAMAALGGAARVPTPVIGGLVAVAGALARRDFAAEGRTLERLGLAGRGRRDILAIVRGRRSRPRAARPARRRRR
jgi:opine dehydrogenase